MASDALSSLGLEGTVIVVSPGEIGVRSTIYSDDEIDRALDDAFELFDASYYDGFATFAGALEQVAVVTTAAQVAATETPSSGGGFIFLLIVVAIVGLIWWAIRRSNRNREGTFQTRIEEVKAEIQGQLSEAANDILELEDDILLSDNQEAKELFYSGSTGYAQFQEQLAGAMSLAQLDELAEGADLALWQLEAAEAVLDGEAPPPRPEARPDFEPPAPPPSSQVRHPELPEELQLRRDRRDVRGVRPRQRSSAGIGGLGTAAVILRSLQQGRTPTVGTSRSARPTGGQTRRDVGSKQTTSRRRTSSPRGSNVGPKAKKPSLKGRARRQRK